MPATRKSVYRLTAAELKLVLAIRANPEFKRPDLAKTFGLSYVAINRTYQVILDKYRVATHLELVKKLHSSPEPTTDTEIS